MDKPLLDDETQRPTEAIIFPLIGRSKAPTTWSGR